jgi:hypothetical protein
MLCNAAAFGSGVTKTAAMTRNTATIKPNDTRVANQGFTRETRSALFIGAPIAWSTPAMKIIGKSHKVLMDVIGQLLRVGIAARLCASMWLLFICLT